MPESATSGGDKAQDEIERLRRRVAEAESRLRRFHENELFGILYWHIDGRVLDVNAKFLEMTGYTREDVQAGRVNCSSMTPPEYWPADEEVRRQLRELGYHRPYEKECIRKDGSRMWGLFSAAAWDSSRQEGVAFILDMTGRRQAEQRADRALAQSENVTLQLRTVLNNMAERLYAFDAAGHILLANESARLVHGGQMVSTLAELHERLDVLSADGRELPFELWPANRLLRGETLRGEEVLLHFKSSGIRQVVSCNGAPVRGHDGRVMLAVLTTIDVSERVRAENELRRSKERLELAADVAKLGEWEINLLDRSATRSLQHARIFGYADASDSWSLGRFLDHVLPEHRAEVMRQIQQTILTGHGEFETEIRRLDGETRWLLICGQSWPEAGEPTRLFGTVMDITQSKRTAQVLLQSEKLATVGRMASTIAHEINNPLEAIGNAIYLAATDPGTSAQARKYLELAVNELDRVNHITRQTLAFHRGALRPSPVELVACVEDVANLFVPRMQSRGVTLETRFRPVPRVVVNRSEVAQIVANLLSNALDATPRNGRILMRVAPTLLPDGKQGVRLTIADTGCGIPQCNRKRIFEPFFTTKEVVGTGLGLWVINQLTQKQGANIQLRSKENAGTVFSLVFHNVDALPVNTPGIVQS